MKRKQSGFVGGGATVRENLGGVTAVILLCDSWEADYGLQKSRPLVFGCSKHRDRS